MKEESQQYYNLLASWQGGWMSVNDNPDIFIFHGYSGNYYLLTYSYDKECGRGSFSLHDIDTDESGCYIHMGMKHCRLTSEESPYGLHIASWGSYLKN